MKHSDSLSSVQFVVIIISTLLGITLLSFPRFIVDKVGIAAPLSGLVGILFGSVAFFGLIYLGRRFPEQTFVGYSKTILGKFFAYFFVVPFLIFALILFSLETRQFAEVLVGGLLPTTPIQIPIFFMIFICAVINYSNVSNFAFLHFFYLPLIIIPLLVVLLPSFKDVEVYHLLPITGHNLSMLEFLEGAVMMMAAISNYFVIAFIIPYLKKPEDNAKYGIWGYFIGTGIFLFLIIMSLGVFGEIKIAEMFWSTLVLARMVEVPGEILARIDAIFIISWIFATFTTLLSYYFVFVRGIAEIFNTKKYKLIASLGIPMAFYIALIPSDIYVVYELIVYLWAFAVLFYSLYVLFLIVIAKIRGKKGSV